MTATLPNRIAGHFHNPPPVAPATAEGRQELWSSAVFSAIALLQSRLASPDPDVAERAARTLIDLEKTRLRHGRELTGTPETKARPQAAPRFNEPLPPLELIDGPQSAPIPFPAAESIDEDEDDGIEPSPAMSIAIQRLRSKMKEMHPDREWPDDVLETTLRDHAIRQLRAGGPGAEEGVVLRESNGHGCPARHGPADVRDRLEVRATV